MILKPTEKPYNFWDIDGQFSQSNDEFFVIFKRNTDETRTTGYWSAEKQKLLWLAEPYLMLDPDTGFYINNMKPAPDPLSDVMENVSASVFFDFIMENTPQCMGYVLFHLSDMRLA